MSGFGERLKQELSFSTSRSSGPGGQNVNKVSTKVTLRFDVTHSSLLTDQEKEVLLHKLKSKLTNEGVLVLSSDASRSQSQNKETVMEMFDAILVKAFTKPKRRKATKPSSSSVEARIKQKKQRSEKKTWRKKYDD